MYDPLPKRDAISRYAITRNLGIPNHNVIVMEELQSAIMALAVQIPGVLSMLANFFRTFDEQQARKLLGHYPTEKQIRQMLKLDDEEQHLVNKTLSNLERGTSMVASSRGEGGSSGMGGVMSLAPVISQSAQSFGSGATESFAWNRELSGMSSSSNTEGSSSLAPRYFMEKGAKSVAELGAMRTPNSRRWGPRSGSEDDSFEGSVPPTSPTGTGAGSFPQNRGAPIYSTLTAPGLAPGAPAGAARPRRQTTYEIELDSATAEEFVRETRGTVREIRRNGDGTRRAVIHFDSRNMGRILKIPGTNTIVPYEEVISRERMAAYLDGASYSVYGAAVCNQTFVGLTFRELVSQVGYMLA